MNRTLLSMACASVLLAACGGGGGGGAEDSAAPAAVAPTDGVPDSASLSVDGLIPYLKALIASAADTLEPVSVAAVTPPTSDTTEPSTVD